MFDALTPRQRALVQAPRSAAVRAGAGTGKTFLLTRRYLWHLTREGLRPMEIVAVTFTEQAANEMRMRIRQMLQQVEDPRKRDWLIELEAAPIGTLHSLAARICRDFPEEAEVPEGFRILDETEHTLWLTEHLEEVLETLPEHFFEVYRPDVWRQMIRELVAQPFEAERALSRKWTPERKRQVLDEIRDLIREEWGRDAALSEAVEVLRTYVGPEGDRMEVLRRQVLGAIEHDGPSPRAIAWLAGIAVRGGSTKAWGKEILQRVREALKTLRTFARKYRDLLEEDWTAEDAVLATHQEMLREAFTRARQYLHERCMQQRVLSFSDLEVHALRALQHPEVQAYYARRWKVVLLDEAQDTSRIQEAILRALKHAHLRVFLVGDEKQSIYGFRGAEAELFEQMQKAVREEGGEVQELELSFRMHGELLEKINLLFDPVFARTGAYAPLKPGLERTVEGAVFELCCPLPEDRDPRRKEGPWLARRIRQLLAEGCPVYDPTTGELRPATPGDIAVLASTWQTLDELLVYLQEAGIPAVNVGGGNLLETPEARDVLALIQFLAHPGDSLALATLLRSPFFGVSDPELYAFARQAGDTSWWDTLRDYAGPSAALRQASEILKPFVERYRHEWRPVAIVEHLNRLQGYTAVMTNLPGAARHEADWEGVIDLLHAYEQGGCLSIAGLWRRLRPLIEEELEIPRPLLEADQAVSLMTIHAAKGLEWPVVFIVRLDQQMRMVPPRVLLDVEWGAAVAWEDEDDERRKPLLYRYLHMRYRQRLDAEAARLAYVGATRARDRLCMSVLEDRSRGLWRVLAPAVRELDWPLQPMEIPEHAPDLPTPEARRPERILLQPVRAAFTSLPVTALNDYAFCPRYFHFRHILGHPGVSEDHRQALRVGTLTHYALEYEVLDARALQAFDPSLPRALVEEALTLARTFFEHPVYAGVRKQIHRREVSVSWHGRRLHLRGRVDALGPDFVLDYKTDREVLPERHAPQLWVYARSTGRPKAFVAYLRHARLHAYSPEELAETEMQVYNLEERLSQGDFMPRPAPETCSLCAYMAICEAGQRLLETHQAQSSSHSSSSPDSSS